MDGPRQQPYRHQCSGPLIKNDAVSTTSQSKCNLLCDFFEERLNDPQFFEKTQQWKSALLETRRHVTHSGRNRRIDNRKKPHSGISFQKRVFKPSYCVHPPPKPRHLPVSLCVDDPDFRPVRVVEVAKAVGGLAPNKASGPDGYSIDIYKNLPQIFLLLAGLFTAILLTGHFPIRLLDLTLIPFDKPGKPPEDHTAKRPIALTCATSKILEVIVLNRLMRRFTG